MLDEKGEQLLSLSSRFSSAPNDAYAALSTADIKHPTMRLSNGPRSRSPTASTGRFSPRIGTRPIARRRSTRFTRLYEANVNTYASLYNGVLQRDWFHAQARGYKTTLDAALHGNNIPTAVVENLIATTKAGTEPLRRYHRLRKRVLGLDTYHTYDTTIPLVEFERKYPYEDVLEWLPASVAPLGADYQRQMREVLAGQCIDVYENPGKRSGAYSAPVYGVPSVHAAELQRHARRRVHAGARDGALDAHRAVARAPAVRVCGLHDFRRRSAVDAERGAVPRLHARRTPPTSASASCCCSTPSTASSRRSTRR